MLKKREREREKKDFPPSSPETKLCTPRTTEQRHSSHLPFVASQMEAYLCMLIQEKKKIHPKSRKKVELEVLLPDLRKCELAPT